jgi:hypothetical protein
MSFASESLYSSRKRNIGVLEDLLFLPTKNVNQSSNKTRRVSEDSESFSNGNNIISPPSCTTTAITTTISNKIDTENSRTLDTHRLVSFCGSSTGTSTSCEESACSSSNYSVQQEQQACYSEVLSSSDTVVTRHYNTRRRKRRRDNKKGKWQQHTSPKNKTKKIQDNSISCTSTGSSDSNKFNNNSKVIGQYAAAYNPSWYPNFWDDSSWSCSKSSKVLSSSIKKKKKKSNCLLATRGSNYTISKIEGLITATSNPLNSKTWGNTTWKLRPISRINDTGKDDIDDNDTTEMEMENERRQNNNIKDCNVPRENSVQWKLWKRLNEPDPQKRIYLLQAPITRLNTLTSRLLTENQPFEDKISSIGSPYILYRWLRVRLAAGLVRSCFDCLHQIIKKNYDEVEDVLKKLEINSTHNEELASLVTARDRLAGIWCVYAHFTLEVGCLAYEEKMKKTSSSQNNNKYMGCLPPRVNTTVLCNPNVISETDSDFVDNDTVASELELYNRQSRSRPVDNDHRKRIEVISSDHQENVTYDDISNHAISILLTARDCPLIGNHTAIALSLGRMIVSSTVMEQSKASCTQVHLSKEIMSAKIQSAIDVCWDNIDTCRSKSHHQSKRRFTTKPVSKTTLRLFSNFEIKNQKLHTEKRIKKEVVLDGIESTLKLPNYIRNALTRTSLPSDGAVIGDRNTVRCLSVELNRWSRLGEELETNHDRTIRLTPFHEPELPFLAAELPLFAPVESLSDPLKLYGDTVDAAETIIWQW